MKTKQVALGIGIFLIASSSFALSCVDGNAVDGDCCSAAGVQEESRYGFSGAVGGTTILSRAVACVNGAIGACEDGIDNDGDGRVDTDDPECSSLGSLQPFAIIGTDPDARFSVRTGGNARVARAGRAPVTVAGFPIVGATCAASACVCPSLIGPFGLPPNPPSIESHVIPDCQAAGRGCSVDADCAVYPYPRGVSSATLCGVNAHLKRESVYEGNVAITGNVRFARGFLGPRNRLELASFFLNNGGGERLDGEPPLVGPGLCSDLSASCAADVDCPLPNACEGRFQLDDVGNSYVDRSGGDANWQACQAAINTNLAALAANIASLPATAPGPGAIKLSARNPGMTLNFPSGTTVLVLPSVTIGKGAQLTLNGSADSVVVLRVTGGVKIGGVGGVATAGGLRPENVLWSIEGAKGTFSARRSGVFAGTVIAPDRKIVKFGAEFAIDGALLGRRVDVSRSVTLRHHPFTALLPTDLSITISAAPAPQNPNVGPGEVVAGEDLQYTLTVANQGSFYAPGVVSVDALPSELTFVALDSVSQGGCVDPGVGNNGNVNCFFGTLAPGASAQARFTARVDLFTANGTIINNAKVSGNVEELAGSDNSATANTVVVAP